MLSIELGVRSVMDQRSIVRYRISQGQIKEVCSSLLFIASLPNV